MTPRISVCICTMNRPAELRRCLAAIERSTVQPHEIIVSDDSRPELATVIKGIVAAIPRARYVEAPRRGLSANRNTCLRHANGDLITFIDDDVIVGEDFLEVGRQEFDRLLAERPGGKFVVTGSHTVNGRRTTLNNLSFLGMYSRRRGPGDRLETLCMSCSFFPAEFFTQASFDENIRYGTEERDIGLQAINHGYEIVYSPRLTNEDAPSTINRDLYQPVVDTARFYFGLKRYWVYERAPLKFAAYNVYALANGVGNRLKRGRVTEAIRVVGSFVEAWRKFARTVLRSRSGGRVKAMP